MFRQLVFNNIITKGENMKKLIVLMAMASVLICAPIYAQDDYSVNYSDYYATRNSPDPYQNQQDADTYGYLKNAERLQEQAEQQRQQFNAQQERELQSWTDMVNRTMNHK